MDELMDVPSSISRAQLVEMFAVIGLDASYLTRVVWWPDLMEVEYFGDPPKVVGGELQLFKRQIPYHG